MIYKGDERAGAIFDESELYRYRLWRAWDNTRPCIAWVMLNPSTADETKLDPTVTRCYGYARAWGFGAFEVVNLCAYRSTDPLGLLQVADPVGPGNDDHIVAAAQNATRVMVAWGAMRIATARGLVVGRELRANGIAMHALKLSKAGHPVHPLYQPADIVPVPWEPKP